MSRSETSKPSRIRQELRETVKRPWRVFNLLNPGKWKRRLSYERLRSLSGDKWAATAGDSGLAHRKYESYEDYLALQKSKLEFLDLDGHEKRFRAALAERMGEQSAVRPGARVLCLGARLGAEVYAFLDCRCFAVGIDLNPGNANPVVLPGDFHSIVFPDASVDVVYSNSLDHCFELQKVCSEVKRLLCPSGVFIVEADPGGEDEGGIEVDIWASLSWNSIEEFQNALIEQGFEVMEKTKFDYPRGGEMLVLRVAQ